MAKALLIVLASALFVSSHYMFGVGRTAYETSEVQSKFEEKIIAQEIATSAFNTGVSKVQKMYKTQSRAIYTFFEPFQYRLPSMASSSSLKMRRRARRALA